MQTCFVQTKVPGKKEKRFHNFKDNLQGTRLLANAGCGQWTFGLENF